jgi:hypothetical protein
MAERALEIGFVDLADRLLRSIEDGTETSRFIQLKSHLLLRQGRAFEALDLLAKLNLPEDTEAMAKAYFEAGAYDAAAGVFSELGAERQQFEAAYRSASASVEGLESADLVQALRRVREPPPEIDTDTLQGVSQLIEASEAARLDIDRFLDGLTSQ